MADFYPLLSRAVANFPDATSEKRQAIYDRARNALLGQLRSVEPAPDQSVIDAELASLDAAIQRVENELPPQPAQPVAAATPPVSTPAAPITPPRTAPRTPGAIIKPPPSRLTPPPPRPIAPIAPPAPVAPAAPVMPVAPPAPPAVDVPPASPGTEASGTAVSESVSPTAPDPAVSAVNTPSTEAPTEDITPSAPAAPPVIAPAVPATDSGEASPAPKLSAPAPGSSYPSHNASASPVAAAPPTASESSPPVTQPERPGTQHIPQEAKPRKKGGLLAAAAVVFVILAAGGGYYAWKERLLPGNFTPGFATGGPANTGRTADAGPENRNGGDNKIASRAQPDDTTAEKPSTPAADAGKQPATPATADASQPGASADKPAETIPVAQRAALLVQQPAADNKGAVKNYAGTVVWSTQNISRGAGQPLSFSVKAEIDVPDAKFHATMTMEKNTDATLPASHMITWRFKRDEGSEIPAISEISVLQMHDDNSQVADPLNGAQAKITPDIYIYALAAPEALQTVNMETLQKRNWFLLPIKLADNRQARISMEKGTPGARVLAEAIEKWGVKISEKKP
jgi:hypothetical protein